MKPRFKVGDIVTKQDSQFRWRITKVYEYDYEYEVVYAPETLYIGRKNLSSIESVEEVGELDNDYMAAKQFDEELEQLLKE